MLPKSQRQAYVGHDDGSKAIKYYNTATKNIFTSRNYRFLVLSDAPPPKEIIINPHCDQGEQSLMREGETRESTHGTEESTCGDTTHNLKKQSAESDINLRDSQKIHGN